MSSCVITQKKRCLIKQNLVSQYHSPGDTVFILKFGNETRTSLLILIFQCRLVQVTLLSSYFSQNAFSEGVSLAGRARRWLRRRGISCRFIQATFFHSPLELENGNVVMQFADAQEANVWNNWFMPLASVGTRPENPVDTNRSHHASVFLISPSDGKSCLYRKLRTSSALCHFW